MALSLCLFAGRALADMAADGRLLAEQFGIHADTRLSGVESGEWPRLANALAEYLAGRADTPQMTVLKNGRPSPAFGAAELEHLMDVRTLVSIGQALLPAGAGCAMASLLLLALGGKGGAKPLSRALSRCLFTALSFLILCGAALALWGSVDFYGLFIAFHRLLFRNELWLLDQGKDLLLQLMPQSIFVSFSRIALARLGMLLAAAGAAAVVLSAAGRERGRKRELPAERGA